VAAELDHLFVLCRVGAPEADALARLGFAEGSQNTHTGQGTASRRFFFRNAYLELLWVHDADEAQAEPARRVRLWDRWSKRHHGACPFGVVLRPPRDAVNPGPPFPTWAYRPAYLPPDLSIEMAVGTPLSEPEFIYLDFQRGRARTGQEPVVHAIPADDITGVSIGVPGDTPRSAAARATAAMGLVSFEPSEDYVLRLTFNRANTGDTADLRPDLPLVLGW
jgi:hypothetical protein